MRRLRAERVFSYGTGGSVRLPGPSVDRPNVYEFGVPYETMQRELMGKDAALYERNGVLNMLDRNKNVKLAPEKFQLSTRQFDVVVTFETRVFDAVVERKRSRHCQRCALVTERRRYCVARMQTSCNATQRR